MTEEIFGNKVTVTGQNIYADAQVNKTTVTLSEIALGDSNGAYYTPTGEESSLVNEVHRINVIDVYKDPLNTEVVVVKGEITNEIGGFVIRETAVYDDAGNMITIGKYPATEIPDSTQGAVSSTVIKLIFKVSNDGNPDIFFPATYDDNTYMRNQYLSYYDDGTRTDTEILTAAISAMNTLGKSLIIDQPVDLAGASVDCLGVGLVWLSEGNIISNGTLTNVNIQKFGNYTCLDLKTTDISITSGTMFFASIFGWSENNTGLQNATVISKMAELSNCDFIFHSGTYEIDTTNSEAIPIKNDNRFKGLGIGKVKLFVMANLDLFRHQGGYAGIEGLYIYTDPAVTGGAGFNGSTVINFSAQYGYSAGNVAVKECQFFGEVGSAGGEVFKFYDGTGDGITRVFIDTIRIRGFNIGIYLIADDGTTPKAYVNSNVFKNIFINQCRRWWVCEIRDGGVIRDNTVEFFGNAGEAVSSIAEFEDAPNYLYNNIYDIPQMALQEAIQLKGNTTGGASSPINSDACIVINDRIALHDIRPYIQTDKVKNIRVINQNTVELKEQLIPNLPLYFVESGAGSSSASSFNRLIKLDPGVGNTYTINSGETFLFNGSSNPYTSYRLAFDNAADYTNLLLKVGISRYNTQEEYCFVADPTDSLGTGIINNWICRIVESDNTTTNIDSGIPFDTDLNDMEVYFLGNEKVRFNFNSENVRTRVIAPFSIASPEIYLENFASGESKEILWRGFYSSYYQS